MRWIARSLNVGGGGVKNSIFGIFRSPAPKLALVPGSRFYYDIDIWYIQVPNFLTLGMSLHTY